MLKKIRKHGRLFRHVNQSIHPSYAGTALKGSSLPEWDNFFFPISVSSRSKAVKHLMQMMSHFLIGTRSFITTSIVKILKLSIFFLIKWPRLLRRRSQMGFGNVKHLGHQAKKGKKKFAIFSLASKEDFIIYLREGGFKTSSIWMLLVFRRFCSALLDFPLKRGAHFKEKETRKKTCLRSKRLFFMFLR